MDVGGVNRIKPPVTAAATDTRRNQTTERDAHGGGYQKQQQRPSQLTPEQEQQAIEALNALPGFLKSGLRAELVRGEEGKVAHVRVVDATGTVVRHLPYAELISLYLNRHSGDEKGQLVRKVA